jgi:MFS family permease
MILGGLAVLAACVVIELKVREPMFNLALFRIRSFTAGNVAGFLAAVGRGGFQFILIIWFQGIWLPLHGYDFTVTPLWAGVYMIPWTAGFVLSGPLAGRLSDRYGARPFATVGMVVSAGTFLLMLAFPANFDYELFALVLLLSGIAQGLFAAPNTSSIMNSVPARDRGAASGMRVTFANTGMPISMGLLFTIMVLGLNGSVPAAMYAGLTSHGVPVAAATQLSHVPPLGYLFAAFLGYNPIAMLLGPKILAGLPVHQAALLTSRQFFPQLIGPAFKDALVPILVFAAVMSLVAAVASALRGSKFVNAEAGSTLQRAARARARAATRAPAGGAVPAAAAAGHGAPAPAIPDPPRAVSDTPPGSAPR